MWRIVDPYAFCLFGSMCNNDCRIVKSISECGDLYTIWLSRSMCNNAFMVVKSIPECGEL